MTSTPPISELVRAAQNGDAQSVEMLISRFSLLIEQECAKFGIWQHPDWSHSDLFQEVIFRVWTKIDQFDSSGHDDVAVIFETWIRTTARSVLNNLHRFRNAKKRRPESEIKSFDEMTQSFVNRRNQEQTASSIFAATEEAERLRSIINDCLDPECQQILTLRIVEGLSLSQISERLGLTYDQVRYKFQNLIVELERRLA